GVFAIVEYDGAVNNHVADAGGILMRLLPGGVVDDGCGIEHGDVGPHAWTEEASVEDVDLRGIRRCHLANRFLHGQDLLIPDVAAEHTGEGAVVARVRVTRGRG